MLDINFRIHKFDEVTSTNDVLRELAYDGCEAGEVVISSSQTKGRGRIGRTFYSPAGLGIYMSILFDINAFSFDFFSLTPLAAAVTAQAIEKNSGQEVKIKWVNDLYMDERKVCGILAEGVPNKTTGKIEKIILGIGINLLEPEHGFDSDIKNIAGAVFKSTDEYDKEKIISDILFGFKNLDFQAAKEFYQKRDYLKGKRINIRKIGSSDFEAEALGIDEDFSLIIKKYDGEIVRLRDEEVTLHKEQE